ncbi:alpha beta-hydrolase [Cylindrobasidium torrendii FP15055 ss-10]|uniref:Alpha beta-hydrolase n=1 Tax=Cylindrobasidium torrendii FP15055 ss-10 TaxID=1314674 RepID=A0A0D7AT18_9AGAR|nr:alpha beta-hydrolase [Cylindrobasidium torrendii FP15055 ss-10]
MSMCSDCIKVVIHEGTPTGSHTKIHGVDCYVAEPSGDYPKDKVLLFLTDAFGIQLSNNLLLVDAFANNGYKTVLMDYFQGDMPTTNYATTNFDINAWKDRHGQEATRPIIDKVIQGLKAEGVSRFAATGYCFGGRYVFDLAFDGVISVAVTAHPSLLEFPTDFEAYTSKATAPLLINSAEIDRLFPKEIHERVDAIFEGFKPGYKRTYFEGCKHGFAVRGDVSDPTVKAAKEGAFAESIKWLNEYF